MNKGPTMIMTVLKSGPPDMGRNFAMWFVFLLVVGVFSAYVAGRALGPGAPYLSVFRFAGVTAFACHVVGSLSETIWYKRSWGRVMRSGFDGLIYALLTGGTFGWLWPE